MGRYRQALKKSYLPHIILIPVIILMITFCIAELLSIGADRETLSAESWVWGLLLLAAFLTWLNFHIYTRRLKKLKEDIPDIEEQLGSCPVSFNDTHYFLDEYFVSFEIPMAVRYEDITSVRPQAYVRRSNGRAYDRSRITLICKNGKKRQIRKFVRNNIFTSQKGSINKIKGYSERYRNS